MKSYSSITDAFLTDAADCEFIEVIGILYQVIRSPFPGIQAEGHYLVLSGGFIKIYKTATAVAFGSGSVSAIDGGLVVAYHSEDSGCVEVSFGGVGKAHFMGLVIAKEKGIAFAMDGGRAEAYSGGLAEAHKGGTALAWPGGEVAGYLGGKISAKVGGLAIRYS